jgi:hypothetical protein
LAYPLGARRQFVAGQVRATGTAGWLSRGRGRMRPRLNAARKYYNASAP